MNTSAPARGRKPTSSTLLQPRWPALGLRVPVDMEGRVIREAFSKELDIEREPPLQKTLEEQVEAYTDEERRILEQRLSELGYLE